MSHKNQTQRQNTTARRIPCGAMHPYQAALEFENDPFAMHYRRDRNACRAAVDGMTIKPINRLAVRSLGAGYPKTAH